MRGKRFCEGVVFKTKRTDIKLKASEAKGSEAFSVEKNQERCVLFTLRFFPCDVRFDCCSRNGFGNFTVH